MRAPAFWWVLGVLCCGTGRGPEPVVTPLPSVEAPARETRGAGVGAVVLVRHGPQEPTARFVEVDVGPVLAGGGAPRIGQTFELGALPHPWSEGSFVVTASQEGADLVVGTRRPDGGFSLVHRVLGRPEARIVALQAAQPTALLVRGGVALMGAGDRVGFVDLRDREPQFTAVHQRTLSDRKAYDLLVVDGDWLVAVDDVVSPIWADSFTLDARGRPVHRAGWELPGVINGHYALGALLGRNGDGRLILAAPYSIMSGHGHALVTLAIRGHALTPLPDHFVLQNHGGTGAPTVLEEHVPRGRSSPTAETPTLLGGTAFSEWTGLAVMDRSGPTRQLVFAAGARGLVVLPAAFDDTSRATLVDVGGHCLDVLPRGDGLLALVGTAPPEPGQAPPPAGPARLVWLRAEAGAWHVVATHTLDAPFTSFVH